MEKISGIYKITNTITGDFYIGSSKNVKQRWNEHKCKSRWKRCPNNPMYKDFQKYGIENFVFEILAEVEVEQLKEIEQQFIEKMHPIYNNNRANGLDIERHKEWQKEYRQSEKGKEYQKEYQKTHKDELKEYQKEYQKTHKDELKEYQIEYRKAHKDKNKEYQKEYKNQLCCFNGETLTLCALASRFMRKGIDHPVIEAKKYLVH